MKKYQEHARALQALLSLHQTSTELLDEVGPSDLRTLYQLAQVKLYEGLWNEALAALDSYLSLTQKSWKSGDADLNRLLRAAKSQGIDMAPLADWQDWQRSAQMAALAFDTERMDYVLYSQSSLARQCQALVRFWEEEQEPEEEED